MREILFRGKRIDNGEWVEGLLSQTTVIASNKPAYVALTIDELVKKPFDGCWHEVDPETVGQYTGMNDRNGQKIFEGDYIRAFLPASKAQREFTWPVMPVVYSRGAFGLADNHGEVTPLRSFALYVTFEVVGNIHDGMKEGSPVESKRIP